MQRGARTVPETLAGDRYRLLEPIGSGGMALVYRAHDAALGDSCAIKLLVPYSASPKTRTRFLSEAETMQRLRHQNVVRVRDVGSEGELDWFAMDLAEEGSVAERVRRAGPRPPAEALAFAFDALCGLDHAHEMGVVHRDVKPHNMLVLSGAPPRVQLTDFGIARHLQAQDGERLTGTGDTLGTLAYMSPEQRVDPRHVGPASDLYGVGATLYFLVTGRRPFDLAVAPEDPTVLARLPTGVREVVQRATLEPAEARFASAREMAVAVAQARTAHEAQFSAPAALEAAFGSRP